MDREREETAVHCHLMFVVVHAQFVVAYSFYAWNTADICVMTEDDICICCTDVTSSRRGLNTFPVAGWLLLQTVHSSAMFYLDIGVFTASLTARRPVMPVSYTHLDVYKRQTQHWT